MGLELRAGHRRARDRKVKAGLSKFRNQQLVLQIIEVNCHSTDPIGLANEVSVSSKQSAGGIAVENALDGKGIVGIDLEGQARFGGGQTVWINPVQLSKVIREALVERNGYIVDPPIFHVGGMDLSKIRVRKVLGSNRLFRIEGVGNRRTPNPRRAGENTSQTRMASQCCRTRDCLIVSIWSVPQRFFLYFKPKQPFFESLVLFPFPNYQGYALESISTQIPMPIKPIPATSLSARGGI